MPAGRPSRVIEPLGEPRKLLLPLCSRRFSFSEICVQDGQRVPAGGVLARDPQNHGVPLLAPRAGTARLRVAGGHVMLDDLSGEPAEPQDDLPGMAEVVDGLGASAGPRYKLLMLGAWQFFADAHTGRLPSPFSTPQAVIISTMHLEPFLGRGDVHLRGCVDRFAAGLERIQSLLEYQGIYLVLPDIAAPLCEQIRESLRGHAFVKVVSAPLRYPFGHPTILARRLGLKRQADSPVWATSVPGVLAVDRALTAGLACDSRVISIGGPACNNSGHVRAMPGYPLADLLADRLLGPDSNAEDGRGFPPPGVRLLDGGILTGRQIGADQLGLDCECAGLTAIGEHSQRELLGFARLGLGRRSFSRCFLSALRRPSPERMTTALRGELRACVSCGFCEEVCPAGIMPHLLHKLLYQDDLEAAYTARLDLCIGCGLCSFVCPSKIELAEQFRLAAETMARETGQVEVSE